MNANTSPFSVYFSNNIPITFHNELFDVIGNHIDDYVALNNTYYVVLLALVIGGAGLYLVDFILSLRYIFRIENKVGELLLHFVVVD